MIVFEEFQLPYHFPLFSSIQLDSIPPSDPPSFIHNAKVRTSVFITRCYGRIFLDIKNCAAALSHNETKWRNKKSLTQKTITWNGVNPLTFLRDWCIPRTKRHCIASLVFTNNIMLLCSGLNLSLQPYGIMQGQPHFLRIVTALYSEFQHPFFKI